MDALGDERYTPPDMESALLKQRALLWGHLIVTMPAVAVVAVVLFFCKYLFVPGWPYYLTIGMTLAYQWYTVAFPRWHMAIRNKGLSEGEVDEIARGGGLALPGASSVGLFALHTTAAGLCATYLSLWLAGYFAHWILPLLSEAVPPRGLDFYLQHFEIANIIPAFLVGCVIAHKFPKLSTWAWLLPTFVIVYHLLTFVDPNPSVLSSGGQWKRFSYYFDIQRVAPTIRFTRHSFQLTGPDPTRGLEQLDVVGPFYCGIAYSFGAFATKRMWLQRIWQSLTREPEPDIIQPEEANVVVVPSDLAEKPLQEE